AAAPVFYACPTGINRSFFNRSFFSRSFFSRSFSAVLFNAGAQPLAAQGAFLQGGQTGIGIRTALKFAQRIARLLAALLLFIPSLVLLFLPQPLCAALFLHL